MSVSSCQSQADYLRTIFDELEPHAPTFNFDHFCCAMITLANSLSHSTHNFDDLQIQDSSELPLALKTISEDLVFYTQDLTLEKKCIGNHPFSMDFKLFNKKKNAEESAKRALSLLYQNPHVIHAEYHVQSAGILSWFGLEDYSIYSKVQYIDNCHLCSCPTKKKSYIQEFKVIDVLNDLDELLESSSMNPEETWLKITLLLLEPN